MSGYNSFVEHTNIKKYQLVGTSFKTHLVEEPPSSRTSATRRKTNIVEREMKNLMYNTMLSEPW